MQAVIEFIASRVDERVVLLRNREVVQWLFGELTFLPVIEWTNKTVDDAKLKVFEDEWGRAMLKKRRPTLKLDKQWTNKFGEHICEEIAILSGKTPTKPVKKDHMVPDLEVDDAIWEVKTQTFFTSGTAGEKIMGAAHKYAEVPILYGKPLKVICLGGAERLCKEKYGNLDGPACTPQRKKINDFNRDVIQVEYVGATDLLKKLAGL